MQALDIPFFGGRLNFYSHAWLIKEPTRYEDRAKDLNVPLKFIITATPTETNDQKKLAFYRGSAYYADFTFEFNKAFNIVSKEFEDYGSGYYHSGNFHITNYRVCKGSWNHISNATPTCMDLFRNQAFELVNKIYHLDNAIVDASDYINQMIKSLEEKKVEALKTAEEYEVLLQSVKKL